jgi:hypothetical protein
MFASSTSRRTHRSHPLVLAAPSTRPYAADSDSSHCDCAAHRAIASGRSQRLARSAYVSFSPLLLPVVACAFCPACPTLLASLGPGLALPDAVHPAGIAIAVLVAVTPAVLRARRAMVWPPLLFVVAGAAVFLATHFPRAGRTVELLGAISLIVGSVLERRASSASRLAIGMAQ